MLPGCAISSLKKLRAAMRVVDLAIGLRRLIREQNQSNLQDLIDTRFLDEMDTSGFFDKLYGGNR
jgi:hypothetical protein